MEFTIKSREGLFRTKKMNAIEMLALQTQIDFDNMKTTMSLYNDILERLEYKSGEIWLPVKEPDKDIYYPAGIEDDVLAIQDLISTFMNNFFKPAFQNSNESK